MTSIGFKANISKIPQNILIFFDAVNRNFQIINRPMRVILILIVIISEGSIVQSTIAKLVFLYVIY